MACGDRGLVAVGLWDGNIEILEIDSDVKVRGWKAFDSGVETLLFTSDGRLVGGSNDGVLKAWDLETGAEVWARDVGAGMILGVCEVADGRLAVGGEDKDVYVLDGVTGLEVMACAGHADLVNAVVSLGGGCHFASGSADGTVRVWASDGTAVRVVPVGFWVRCLTLSPCGQFVAAGSEEGSVGVHRLPDWDQVWTMQVHGVAMFSLPWIGRFLASGSADKTVKILSADSGATLRTLRGHSDWVRAVLFTADGTKVLSGSDDKTVRVWRIFSKAERRVRGLVGGLEVHVEDWEMKEVCCEIVERMKRLWEVEEE
jgi:WD40 repeat protein